MSSTASISAHNSVKSSSSSPLKRKLVAYSAEEEDDDRVNDTKGEGGGEITDEEDEYERGPPRDDDDDDGETTGKKSRLAPENDDELEKTSRYANDEGTKKVYVWDLDETLIIFQSMLSGVFARQHRLDSSHCESLALKMEDLIVDIAEKRFFFEELERDGQRMHIDGVNDDNDEPLNVKANHLPQKTDSKSTSPPSKSVLKERYASIRKTYQIGAEHLFENAEARRKWMELRDEIESLTDRWTSEAAVKCLTAVEDRREKSVNVLVTNSQLVAAFVKLILNGLSRFFPIHNVYSSSSVGKERCFSSIRSRFPSSSCVVIGDGAEEENAAEKFDFLFWKVSSKRDLIGLNTAVNLNYM